MKSLIRVLGTFAIIFWLVIIFGAWMFYLVLVGFLLAFPIVVLRVVIEQSPEAELRVRQRCASLPPVIRRLLVGS